MKKALRNILIILGVLIVSTVLIVLDSYINIDVSHYEIKSDKLNQKYNNYKIMLLTDLHNRDITEKLVKIVNEENPNIIVMSGDMINEKVDGFDNFFNLCRFYEIMSYSCNIIYRIAHLTRRHDNAV